MPSFFDLPIPRQNAQIPRHGGSPSPTGGLKPPCASMHVAPPLLDSWSSVLASNARFDQSYGVVSPDSDSSCTDRLSPLLAAVAGPTSC